jgi:hypothetical protein
MTITPCTEILKYALVVCMGVKLSWYEETDSILTIQTGMTTIEFGSCVLDEMRYPLTTFVVTRNILRCIQGAEEKFGDKRGKVRGG